MNTSDVALKYVRAALRQTLLGVAGIPAAAYWSRENRDFSPPSTDTAWLREFFIPQSGRVASLGNQGRLTRYNGTYLIDVFLPSGEGTNAGDILCGKIVQAFEPGSHIIYSSQVVRISSAYSSRGLPDDRGWWQRPLTVVWESDSQTL